MTGTVAGDGVMMMMVVMVVMKVVRVMALGQLGRRKMSGLVERYLF